MQCSWFEKSVVANTVTICVELIVFLGLATISTWNPVKNCSIYDLWPVTFAWEFGSSDIEKLSRRYFLKGNSSEWPSYIITIILEPVFNPFSWDSYKMVWFSTIMWKEGSSDWLSLGHKPKRQPEALFRSLMIKKGMRFVPTIITLTPFIIKFSCDFLRNVTVNAKSGISDALYDEATLYKSEYEVRIQTNTSKKSNQKRTQKTRNDKKIWTFIRYWWCSIERKRTHSSRRRCNENDL